jgi:hypothetical protein
MIIRPPSGSNIFLGSYHTKTYDSDGIRGEE